MPNRGVAIELEPADRMQLETWQSSHGTPQQVALRCRIILAALAGEDNVSIAEAAGYDSDAAFGRAFKRITGITPGRWRAGDGDSRPHMPIRFGEPLV